MGIGDWGLGIGVFGVGRKNQDPKAKPPQPKNPKFFFFLKKKNIN